MKQSHCVSLCDGVTAQPKLSHLLSQWVSWAQGVWDVAVCRGRGNLCEHCVGEAKKNITAWQLCCREWRMRRRFGGEEWGKGTLGVWRVCGGGHGHDRGEWKSWCLRVRVRVRGGGGRWANISECVVRSYSLHVIPGCGWGFVVGLVGRRGGMGRKRRERKRER